MLPILKKFAVLALLVSFSGEVFANPDESTHATKKPVEVSILPPDLTHETDVVQSGRDSDRDQSQGDQKGG